jgi:hypothetical protein
MWANLELEFLMVLVNDVGLKIEVTWLHTYLIALFSLEMNV